LPSDAPAFDNPPELFAFAFEPALDLAADLALDPGFAFAVDFVLDFGFAFAVDLDRDFGLALELGSAFVFVCAI
jgi:hypothetical protein